MTLREWVREGAKEWSVAVLGFLLLVGTSTQVYRDADRLLVDALEMGLPFVVGVGLVLGGAWLRTTVSERRIARIALWTVAGATLGAALNLWFVFVISQEPSPAGEAAVLNLNGAAVLMAAGTVLGYYATGLRQRERALERSEARFRALTENASFAVLTIDETGTIRYANDAVTDLFGHTPADLVGNPFTTLLPERMREDYRTRLNRYLAEGTRRLDWSGVERIARHADGHEVPIELSFGEHTVGDDHLFTGVIRDISERREYEREMEALSTAMETSIDGMAILDETGEYQFANQAHADVYGYDDPEAFLGETWRVCYDDEEVDRFEEEVLPVLTETGGWRGEAVGMRKNGSTFSQELSLTVLDDGGLVCVVRDITERKEMEDQLRTHTDRVTRLHELATTITRADTKAAIHQRAADGAAALFPCDVARLAVADGDQLVPTTSSRDEPLDQYSPSPVTAGYAGTTYRSGEVLRVDDLTETRSATTAATPPEDSGLRPDGADPHPSDDPLDDHRSLLSIPLGDEGVLQLFAAEANAFTDRDEALADLLANHVTTALDRVAAEATIRRERDRLDEFANVVSHDLRNPIEVAIAGVELTRVRSDGDLAPLDRTEAALDRMQAIVDDLLTLARQGETAGETEPVNLAATAREAWQSVASDEATLRTDSPGWVEADRSRLLQLFENLFRNAVDHGGDSVTVTVDRLADGFYVEDTGPGIPPAERERVFESGYSTDPEGSGFGLPIVNQIVDAHEWAIAVTGGGDGGARFEITGVEILDEQGSDS